MEQNYTYFAVSPEMELMLTLATRDSAWGDLDFQLNRLDWNSFKSLVYKNAIPSLVSKGSKKLPQEVVEQYPILQEFQKIPPYYKIRCMKQMQALAIIAKDFEENGIRMFSLKGPLLAMELYGNPELRLSSDLDLLVEECQLQLACERLEQKGFSEKLTVYDKTPKRRALRASQHEDMHRVFVKEDIIIEIHWRISFRFEQSFDSLWECKREKRLLGQNVNVLGELDHISYLICHAAGHGYQQMRWLLDLYILLKKPSLDFVALYQYMDQKGIAMMLVETLTVLYRCKCFQMASITNDLFSFTHGDTNVQIIYQDDLKEQFEKGFVLAEIVWPLLLKIANEEGYLGRKYKQLLPQLEKRSSFLLSFFQPRKADLELIDLPDSLFFLYYLIRPFYKLWRMTPFYHADNQHE